MLLTNRYGLATIAILTVGVALFGVAHGAAADSVADASVDHRMSVDELTEEEPREPKLLPDEWFVALDRVVPQPEPNPWLQERVVGAAVWMGNQLFEVADRSAQWGYNNRGWIAPAWVRGLARLYMFAGIITLGASQVVRFRKLKLEGAA